MPNALNLGRVGGLVSLLMAALPMLAIAIVGVSTGFTLG